MTDDAASAASLNPFDQYDPDKSGTLPAAEEDADNPFAQYGPKPIPSGSSTGGAFARGAERGALPALGGLAAAGAGAELGAAAGAFGGPAAPITVPAGALIGGIAGALGGGYVVSKAQDWLLSKAPDSWREAIGQDERQQTLDEQQHPYASFLGGLAPYALTMRPGMVSKVALPENATALQRIMANPVTARVFGGAAMGGMELGQEAAAGQNPDWTKVAISTGAGLVFNKPTRFGEAITEIGARPARGLVARETSRETPEPTLAQAGDAKVAGPGITEAVFHGNHEQSESAALTAQDAARTEQVITGEPEAPGHDVHEVVRQMHPELFDQYDALAARRDTFRRWIEEFHNPPDEAFGDLAAQKADLEERLAAVPISGAGRNLPEARRLRAQIRDLDAQVQQLNDRRTAFTEGRAEETPDLTAARQQLLATDFEMRDLAPHVSAAYRRAADAIGAGTVPAPETATNIPENIPTAPETAAKTTAEAANDTITPSVIGAPPARSIAEQKAIIGNDVARKLIAAGRPEEEATAVGHLIAERYATRAARFDGALGTPEELYAKEGAEIRGPKDRAASSSQEASGPIISPDGSMIPEALRDFIAKGGKIGGQKARELAQGEQELFQRDQAPPFHSVVERTVESAKQEKGTPEQWLATIRNAPGVKREEMEWLGLEGWLKGQKGSVSKQQIADYVRANNIQVTERMSGENPNFSKLSELDQAARAFEAAGMHADAENVRAQIRELPTNAGFKPRYSQYTVPGAQNYRELLLKLPPKPGTEFDPAKVRIEREQRSTTQGSTTLYYEGKKIGSFADDPQINSETKQYQQRPESYWIDVMRRRFSGDRSLNIKPLDEGQNFRSAHWDEPNVLAHVRFDDRVIDGKKTLLLEEVQSDWHQKGRKEGYGEGGVPDAPFKTSWPELAMKRMIRYAAEHGYEQVAWVPGSVQAERYDLSKQVSRLAYVGDHLKAWDHAGKEVISEAVSQEKLPDYIGKEAAEKLLAQEPKKHETLGSVNRDDLAVTQSEHQYHVKNSDGRSVDIGKGTVGSEDEAKDYAIRYLNARAHEINLGREREYGRIGETRELSGLDLKVGGEGMRGFYDEILPKTVNKLIKKFGAKVGESRVELPAEKLPSWTETSSQRVPSMDRVHVLPLTDELRTAATEQGFPLFQGARGKIGIAEGRRPIITLMKDANASTFIHETGHQWLEELMRDAEHPAAPDLVKDDATTVRDWLGVDSAEDIKTRHHEKFARGFEQYMREGVAPSPGLAGVFQKFKNWLTTIYQTLKGLGKEISPDIRDVFDRMIATEPQRTVIAPERPGGPTLADIHEADAAEVEPHEAESAADRVAAERARYIQEPPPEIEHEIAPVVAEVEAARQVEGQPEPGAGAEPAGEAGSGAGGSTEVVERGGDDGAQPASGGVGPGRGEERGGGGEAKTESPSVPGAADRRGAAEGAGSPLSPNPAALFGPRESPFVDKAGNIRLENLTSREDVAKAIRDAAEENDDFIGDRRGTVTDGQVMDLADALGMDAAQLNQRKVGQAFNAEQIIAARKLLIQSATDVSETMKRAAAGTDEDVMAYALAKGRHQMIQGQVAGITAEAGRALRAFRSITGQEEAQGVDQFLRSATAKTLFQLREEAKLGAQLDSPAKVSKFLADAQKRTFGRMILEYWVNGLISGPMTHATYAVGNQALAIMKAIPETAAAALVGSIRTGLTGGPERVRLGETWAQMKARGAAMPGALEASLEALRSGQTTLLPGEQARPLIPFQGDTALTIAKNTTNEHVTWSELASSAFGMARGLRDGIVSGAELIRAGGIEGAPTIGLSYSPLGYIPDVAVRGVPVVPIGTALRLPGRAVAAIHSFFRTANYSMEKAAVAFRTAANEGLTGTDFDRRVAEIRQNPSEEVMEQARHGATELTLMGKGSEFVQAMSKLTNTNIFGFPYLKFVDPFVHIAGSIIDQSIVRRTPLGLLAPELRADVMGKNGPIAQDQAIGRMLVGTALGVTFGGLAAQGLASGSGPSDPKEAAMWRLAGNQAHSVRIGDFWYDTHRLGPLGMLGSVAADLYEVGHKIGKDDASDVAHAVMHAFTHTILDESFMRGPSDLIKALEDPDRYGGSYVRNFLSSFVPFSVGMAQVARRVDPYSRQARTMMDAVRNKLPFDVGFGKSTDLFARRDIWGEPMMHLEGVGLTSIYASQISNDPVNRAMLDLGVFPGAVQRKIRNVDLTDAQYDDFARIAGRMTKMRLDAIVRSPDYQMWPNHVRHDVIDETVRQSREAARGVVMMKYPQIIRDAADAKIKEARGE